MKIFAFIVVVPFFLSDQKLFATSIFADRVSFEASIVSSITDDYSATGYLTGDIFSDATISIHTDASMSAVLGETEYTTTGFADINKVVFGGWYGLSEPAYCAGCNGTFRLSFLTTSISGPAGVFGVGFDILRNADGYVAFVTLGDSSTEQYPLPIGFFGITSAKSISSIHVGLAGGVATTAGHMVIDNLTIGAEIPEPTSVSLLFIGLAASILLSRLRRRRLPSG